MAEKELESLAYTPTWVVAVVCIIIVLISLLAERALHHLGKCLKRAKQESLFEALQKIKEELMILGFISLLLTVFQGFISKICIPKHLTLYMLPCAKEAAYPEDNTHKQHVIQHSLTKRRLLSEGGYLNHCSQKGMAQFLSVEALHQLHMFVFVLAIVYVIFCATTMILGGAKVRRWKRWEDLIRSEISKPRIATNKGKITYPQHHQFQFFKQRKGYSTILSLVMSFFKQFYGSVTKSDYIALRHGFIMTHCPSHPKFDFLNYMMRTLEYDFKKVVGVSWYLWAFVVLFLLVNLKGWHAFFWLSFLPLILLLIVGAKLEYIITSLAKEIEEKKKDNMVDQCKREGDQGEGGKVYWVKPSDEHFWLRRPRIVLYLIHFILFQNSFENAFIIWVLFTYGIHSCIIERIEFIIPRLIVGVVVQVLCGYSTLPLYTIVTQMGSMFNKGIFDPMVLDIVQAWAEDVRGRGHRHSLSRTETQNITTATESYEIAPTGLCPAPEPSRHSCST